MASPGVSPAKGPGDDPLPEALTIVRGAAGAGLGLKLLGGLAVRVLCPGFPPRTRSGQDIDLACLSRERTRVTAHLEASGCQADRRFNMLNGDRQLYFISPSGRPIDVVVDRLSMCHTLDFRPSFGRLPYTLDAIDLLLSKLQIVELNQKDAHDIVHLLAGVPVDGDGGAGGRAVLDTGRFCKLLGSDWGWWRTVTGNLGRLPDLLAQRPGLVPAAPAADPVSVSRRLLGLAESAPKGVKWRLRSNVGDRVRWYELPEEVAH